MAERADHFERLERLALAIHLPTPQPWLSSSGGRSPKP